MARRKHGRKKKPRLTSPSVPGTAPVATTGSLPGGLVRPMLLVAFIALGLGVVFWLAIWPYLNTAEPENTRGLPPDKKAGTGDADPAEHVGDRHGPDKPEPAKDGPRTPAGNGSFLQEFKDKGERPSAQAEGHALSNAELEKHFEELVEIRRLAFERKQPVERFNRAAAAFEKEMAQARQARPKDPVPQWLTGELMKLVGAEPGEILPYLQRAAGAGLDRARLFASLAQVQIQANRFDEAYRSAGKALDRKSRDHYVWNAYTRASFALQKFAEVVRRADRAFPDEPPTWAKEIRAEASRRQAHWQAEQQLRKAERQADDLPRVRLVIQHRRFVQARGSTQAKIENTGKGEVIIELFEDQAPAAVANFIDLVSRGYYDGTRFHQAEPAALIAGGDPKSKDPDPGDDGTGGPGYVIPDEFQSKKARRHFRGSVSMVNTGPHTAGSQFFITLVPNPAMDGHFTVFGRVIQGQEVIDHITPGRTTKAIGRHGKIIPGDLLLRAEVIRKRPHPYRVIKE